METLISNTQAPPDAIKDTDTEHFVADVLEASREVPVVVDFWAPWCGPCKTLGPMLEKVVGQAGSAVKLVKVNIDENPQIASQFRIQSIPAVFAFDKGQPVDGFVGALPESQIKQFVQRLTGDQGPSEIDQAVEMAEQAVLSDEIERAVGIFGQVLRVEPDNAAAIGGLAQCHIKNRDLEQARQVLDAAGPEIANDQKVASARAALDLAEGAQDSGDAEPLRAAVAADPNNHQARFDLANALVAQNEREEAVDHLLEIVQRDRNWNEEAARTQLLKLFEAFGLTDPLTVASRRRLSSILFS